MKKCYKCSIEKSTDEFSKSKRHKDGSHIWCRKCVSLYDKERYKDPEIKQRIRDNRIKHNIIGRIKLYEYLKKCYCKDCTESNPIVLDFDHKKDKLFNISDMIGRISWERIEKEIAKCEVVCANCHRIRTARRLKWYKYISKDTK